jgi:tRNA U38,U39,U40 pseudouridine synthase TruA
MNTQADIDDSEVSERGPISAFGEAAPPTDAERYRWIRANRTDAALHAALRNAHFDHDFNDQIDAAMRAQREGQEALNVPRTAKPFGRRRSDFE